MTEPSDINIPLFPVPVILIFEGTRSGGNKLPISCECFWFGGAKRSVSRPMPGFYSEVLTPSGVRQNQEVWELTIKGKHVQTSHVCKICSLNTSVGHNNLLFARPLQLPGVLASRGVLSRATKKSWLGRIWPGRAQPCSSPRRENGGGTCRGGSHSGATDRKGGRTLALTTFGNPLS